MKVAIDVRTVTQARSGVGNYVLNLLNGLRSAAPEHKLFWWDSGATWRSWTRVNPRGSAIGPGGLTRAIPMATSGSTCGRPES
ncbi:hypothetical protein DFAR_40003 [Desulfarculales bacterium]